MPLTHISDTARWIAVMRARETARPDALFEDPLAGKIAGVDGRAIEHQMRARGRMPDWPIVMRTLVLDEHILRGVADGVDMVIDLAAGMDTRPYRLPLPRALTWVDVDRAPREPRELGVTEHVQTPTVSSFRGASSWQPPRR